VFDGMCWAPLVEYGVGCRLAKSATFAIDSFGCRALMFVRLALACEACGDAVESIAWLAGDVLAPSTGVEVDSALHDLGDGLTQEILEDLVDLRHLLEAVGESLFEVVTFEVDGLS